MPYLYSDRFLLIDLLTKSITTFCSEHLEKTILLTKNHPNRYLIIDCADRAILNENTDVTFINFNFEPD